MRTLTAFCFWGLMLVPLFGCGSKKAETSESDKAAETGAAPGGEAGGEKPEVEEAQKQIRNWLGKDVTDKVSKVGKDLGKVLGEKFASNPQVIAAFKKLASDVFKAPEVKSRLKKIEERATAGFGKKLSLGWKALKAGGIDELRNKVSADAQRVAVDVVGQHVKESVLKDERFKAFLKDFSPVLKVQGQVAALAMQDNLSPRVTKKILSLALTISSAKGDPVIAERVNNWLRGCEGDEDIHIEKMVAEVAALPALDQAAVGLGVEVLGHERTRKELIQLVVTLVDDPAVNKALEKVYEAASFEKGDEEIKKAMEGVIALEIVDTQLFATLNRLASAEGAGPMIGRHLTKATGDQRMAAIVENFVIGLLETCGEPSAR